MNSTKHTELAGEVWKVADLLRGDYKRSDYGKVILPLTVLRRLECVLEPTRAKVQEAKARFAGQDLDTDRFLRRATGNLSFYNTSTYTLKSIGNDPTHAAANLNKYIAAFSPNAQAVMERYEFGQQIKKLHEADLLYLVLGRFAGLDLRPETVSNHQMGYVFEDLIRRFAEQSNETAGEHFTPREVIELMVNLLVAPDGDALGVPGAVRTVLDPACGTGGMLSAAEEHITRYNKDARVEVYGQELNPESWAICRSDLMIKGQNPEHIRFGNSFSDDGHYRQTFDYLLANPPFGVDWKKVKDDVEHEHRSLGESGRFGAGLPRINDGSLLFLQHMLSKMKPVAPNGTGGSRVAIVFNGSPLFTGAADSGESRIRRWIIENDWLEAVVALPDQLFYNTGISTYFWILTNRKAPEHEGKVVMLDARGYFAKMRKSLGDKRKFVTPEQITEITRLYGEALQAADDAEHQLHAKVKVFANKDFGYRRITVERPLKLHFEITDDTLTRLAVSRPITNVTGDGGAFAEALRPLLGTVWRKKTEAWESLREAVRADGGTWPSGAPFLKALRDIVGVRVEDGEVQMIKGGPEPDPELRDYENVPLDEDVSEYLEREVTPHVPDAWIDHTKTKIGYEIPFTRNFYVYEPPRAIEDIDIELRALELEIQKLFTEVAQ